MEQDNSSMKEVKFDESESSPDDGRNEHHLKLKG